MNLDKLYTLLELHEGVKLHPYVDTVGKITIGVGHNLSDRGITQETCALWLAQDVQGAMADLDRALPWWRQLDDVRQRVFVELVFNMGIEKFLRFTSMLKFSQRAITDARNWMIAAANLQDSVWFRQVGPYRGPRLVEMLRTGQDPPELRASGTTSA